LTAPASGVEPVHDPARAAAIARTRRRNVAVSTASTVLVLGAAVVFIITSPGWPAVQQAFFSWPDAKRALPKVVDAMTLTIILFLTAEVAILMLALLIAVVRGLTAPIFTPLRLTSIAYVDIVRGIPTILLLFLFAFGIPALNLQGVTNSELIWGWAALVVSYSAYVSEVLRAGLESVHPSQRAAARALGLSQIQSLRFVVVPQAVRRVLPPLLNDFIALQKDTALLSLVGVVEVFRVAQVDAGFYFNFTPYVVVAVFFILLTVPLSRYADWLAERRRRVSQASAGGL